LEIKVLNIIDARCNHEVSGDYSYRHSQSSLPHEQGSEDNPTNSTPQSDSNSTKQVNSGTCLAFVHH